MPFSPALSAEQRPLAFRLLLALLAAGLLIAAVWPGYLSFDSSFMWWQARTLALSNLQSSGMTLVLAALLRLGASPGLLVALHIGAFFLLLAWLPSVLGLRLGWRVLLLALSPPLLLLLPHLWSDVHLLVVLLAAALFLLAAAQTGARALRMLAFVALAYALLVRPNALAAVLPLACALSLQSFARWPQRLGLIGAVLVVGFLLGRTLDRVWVVEHRDAWAVLLLWDLQAIGATTGEVELPAGLYYPSLTAAAFKASFDPDTAMGVFNSPVANPGAEQFTQARKAALLKRWWEAVRAHPEIYLAHRARTFGRLLGPHRDGTAVHLFDMPGQVAFRDNPPLASAWPSAHERFRALAEMLKSSGLAAPWLWLGLGSTLLAIGTWQRRRRLQIREQTLLLIGASALAYLLPYALIAPSTEMRYLAWSICGLMLAGLGMLRTSAQTR